MSKTIILNQDSLISIKESMVGTDGVSHNLVCVNEARPEVDEFELGQETDNPPVGGNYSHVTETIKEGYCCSKLKNIDLSDVGKVECECYFDGDEYNEWLVDNELIDSQEARIQYYTDELTYQVTYLDNETFHMMDCDYTVMYSDLEELFGEDMAETILKECMKNGKYDFETYELYANNSYDLSNPQEVNDIAMKLFSHGEYYKDCRGFILSNGIIVYTPSEHNEICMIPGVESKFQFIKMGNIRLLPNSIDIGAEPTNEQEGVLREVIASYSDEELYVDIFSNNNEIGVKYTNPDWRYVMGEIDRYYSEGIKPQGDNGRYYMDENTEIEVRPSEVDLSSFKKKKELPPIWEDEDTLDSRVRLKLLDIADDFWEFVNLTWVKPSGIILTGSICNFNWSRFSDIDLHLVVDFDEIDEKTEFVKDYLDSKKNEWNNEHKELIILGFPVELYVQNLGEMPESGGIYDLEDNSWLRKPNSNDIKSIGLDKFSIKDRAAQIMTIIDDMNNALHSTTDSHEIEEIGDDASYLWKKIKDMRGSSLRKNGESGAGNIVYKILRRTKYLDKLWKLSTSVYDRSNSINESVDGNTDMFKLAIEHFGTTNDIRECGYILPDGTMLDFSGRYTLDKEDDSSHLAGRRGIDHRNIYEIGWSEDGNTKNFDITMEDFIRLGAIRIHASKTYVLINLYKKPTSKQVSLLIRLIQYAKGCVDVEIGDGNESLSYAEFDNVKPSVVISQINRFFDEGINLMGNVSESVNKFKDIITLLKEESLLGEEFNADGNTTNNPYKKRWDAERKALKDFVCMYGKLMQSKEDDKNGKLYKCFWDKTISNLIGYNYCLCVQWDNIEMKPKSVVYIRACDKFTPNIKQVNFDTRGRNNIRGDYDDLNNTQFQRYQ